MALDKTDATLLELGYVTAENPKTIVYVIGAGVSAAGGLPSWDGLMTTLMAASEEFVGKYPSDKVKKLLAEAKSLHHTSDYWRSTEKIEQLLPKEEYDAVVRSALSTEGRQVPDVYELLWRLQPAGIVDFNLDDFAARSAGQNVRTASWNEPAKYQQFLLSGKTFLYHAHGQFHDRKSWVLTKGARDRVYDDQSHRRFIVTLLGTKRFVFLGFRPSDFTYAALHAMSDVRMSLGDDAFSHFWVASGPVSPETKGVADNLHARIIEYTPSTKAHPEVRELLGFLLSAKPRPPSNLLAYSGPAVDLEDLPDDDVLSRYSGEEIRQRLNAVLPEVVKAEEDLAEKLIEFFERYPRSIQLAWLVSQRSPQNMFWGYRLQNRAGTAGAFGEVWHARDVVTNESVAIKLLHHRIASQTGFMQAFHRGIRAFRILEDAGLKGVVHFVRSFDVPPSIVMEYIDGETLEQMVARDGHESLAEALSDVRSVAEIVLRGHRLPENVLHRDVKPANAMVRFNERGQREVVVLDFDLSWYEGAVGESIAPGAAFLNYIAPELLSRGRRGPERRSAAVDVFGVGMLMYFVVTKKDPPLGLQEYATFRTDLAASAAKVWGVDYAHARAISRVIEECTYSDPGRRIPLDTALRGLEEIVESLSGKAFVIPSRLLLELVSQKFDRDVWKVLDSVDGESLAFVFRQGRATISVGFETGGSGPVLRCVLNAAAGPESERRNMRDFFRNRIAQAKASLLKHSHWVIDVNNSSADAISATAVLTSWTAATVDGIGQRMAEALETLAMV